MTAILQIENRHNPYFEYCIMKNKSYALKHDIHHLFYKNGPSNIPYYWWKVFKLHDLLATDKYDIIVWMDSDAYVHQTSKHPRDFFDAKPMIICGDPPNWGSPFMAAVFMIKNTPLTKEIVSKWKNLYDPTKWMISNKRWIDKTNEWAGSAYEQGAFVKNILPEYADHIKIVKWYVFHETKYNKPHKRTWSVHLPHPFVNTRLKFLQWCNDHKINP